MLNLSQAKELFSGSCPALYGTASAYPWRIQKSDKSWRTGCTFAAASTRASQTTSGETEKLVMHPRITSLFSKGNVLALPDDLDQHDIDQSTPLEPVSIVNMNSLTEFIHIFCQKKTLPSLLSFWGKQCFNSYLCITIISETQLQKWLCYLFWAAIRHQQRIWRNSGCPKSNITKNRPLKT